MLLSKKQNIKTWNTKKKRSRKISETKFQNHSEIQALQVTILGPPLTIHDSWSMDHFMDCQLALFPNRVPSIHSGIQERKMS